MLQSGIQEFIKSPPNWPDNVRLGAWKVDGDVCAEQQRGCRDSRGRNALDPSCLQQVRNSSNYSVRCLTFFTLIGCTKFLGVRLSLRFGHHLLPSHNDSVHQIRWFLGVSEVKEIARS